MRKHHVLVIEDEEDIRELLRFYLDREGYDVLCVETGEEALKAVGIHDFDLFLLDLMLPGIDGLEICRLLKQRDETREIPVLMVTAKGEDEDIITGLELGADDYITKPFSPKVLIARIRAVLRRKEKPIKADDATLSFGELKIHPGKHEVHVEDELVDLTQTEFRILHFLALRPGWVFTRYQIVDAVHGENYDVSDRSIDVQIVGLRRRLKNCGHYIKTVRGVGYRFTGENE